MRGGFTSLKITGFLHFLLPLLVFLVAIVAAGLAVPALAAGPSAEPDSKSGLPLMFDDGERLPTPDLSTVLRVRILISTDFPPFSFTDQTGRLSGFNVDLAREICSELKLEPKCQIQAVPYQDMPSMLENGAGEAAMAGMAVTSEMRRRFLFSRPYLTIPARFARNRSKPIATASAAALSGRPVGVVAGTAHELMLKAFFPAIVATPFDTYEAMLEGVRQGKVDAVFADGLRLPFWVASNASQGCCELFDGAFLSQRFLGEGMAVMIRNNDPLLVAAFNQALLELSRNGRLDDLYLRYFPNGLF